MNHGVAVTILTSGVALAVPLLWAALGEVINEKAGVLNVGIEGVMLISAFVAALILHDTDSLILAAIGRDPDRGASAASSSASSTSSAVPTRSSPG